MNETSNFIYKGFNGPKGTIVPDDVFDVLLPQLSDPELRILLYIIRKTFGWKKDSDNISLSQMVSGITTKDGRVLDRGAGLSKSSAIRGIQGLAKKGVIKAVKNQSRAKGNEPTTYELRFEGDPLSNSDTRGLSQTDTRLVSELDTQRTPLQLTDINHSNVRMRSHAKNNVDNSESQVPLPHRNASASVDGKPRTTTAAANVSLDDGVLNQAEEAIKRLGMEGLGDILKRGRGRSSKHHDEEREMVLAFIGDFAREFADQAQLKSSVSRALNIYKESGLSSTVFQDRMYQARTKTKERRTAIKGSQMAYFFACLEQEAGLREAPEGGSSDTLRVLNR